jgi:uncharacterized protein (TIGR03067 family)
MPWRMFTVAVVVCMVGADAPEDRTKHALEDLQGKWVLTAQEANGQETKVPAPCVGDARIFIRGNQMVTVAACVKQEGNFHLSKPNRIDMMDRTGKLIHALYRLDDGVLKICMTPTGDRPAGFSSRDGSAVIGVYRRATPDDPDLAPFSVEMKKLQGTWKLKVKRDVEEDEEQSVEWVVKGDELTIRMDGEELSDKATVVLNPKTQPGNIGLMFPGSSFIGNYSLDDDVLTITRAGFGGPQQLIVLKRVN